MAEKMALKRAAREDLVKQNLSKAPVKNIVQENRKDLKIDTKDP